MQIIYLQKDSSACETHLEVGLITQAKKQNKNKNLKSWYDPMRAKEGEQRSMLPHLLPLPHPFTNSAASLSALPFHLILMGTVSKIMGSIF